MKTSGIKSFAAGRWRLQIYWPVVTINRKEIYIDMANTFRVFANRKDTYYGGGFNLVGFGIGLDYWPNHVTAVGKSGGEVQK